jgi:putative DNA methylase
MSEDLRLIEDYLPIEAISAEASREKSVRKGHISTLHLWWARRPLVACRAAVYEALVPPDHWVREVKLKNHPGDSEKAEKLRNGKKKGLNRRAAGAFVTGLCKYPKQSSAAEVLSFRRHVAEATEHVLHSHATQLTAELQAGQAKWANESHFSGNEVTVDDIREDRAPRPRLLDLFAGGGAIPLEALRLGCETYAVDLNPVAYVIMLCTLVYPQRFGRADPKLRGMTGPKDSKGHTTWGGLAEEIRHWGAWVLSKAREEIGDLYPLIPDPTAKTRKKNNDDQKLFWKKATDSDERPAGYIVPLAYLWSRTVGCKKRTCGASVPMLRQTWLCRSEKKSVAVKVVAPRGKRAVRFEVVQAKRASALGFDPAAFSSGGNATCPFCHTVADEEYVKAQGFSPGYGQQLMAVVYDNHGERGKHYLDPSHVPDDAIPTAGLDARAETVAAKYGIWRHVFSPRQLVAMTAFAGIIRAAQQEMQKQELSCDTIIALCTSLSMALGRLADYCTSFATWQPEFVAHTFDTPGLPMIMDFAEPNPLIDTSGSWPSAIDYVAAAIEQFAEIERPASVTRCLASETSWPDETFDAIVTDPPYYDSRSYSNLSDHFYVWHKRSIGNLYPEHFASQLTPKKKEAIAAAYRHGGSREKANKAYEDMMQEAFMKCNRLLKPNKPMVCVYAHKTTVGWSTLINALMRAGFTVVEAWPVDMERKVRQNAQNTAALASSIFLVARKRAVKAGVGDYDSEVHPDLEQIVRERVENLWDAGISGADLVIAAVGAGLRSFTRFERVEYANGEEVPAKQFLTEVETVVLDSILGRLSKEVGGNGGRTSLAGVDPPTRFYILWRYTYKATDIDAGEAIVFANGTHVELDGPEGLTAGSDALLEKKKGKYRLRDFSERGDDDDLGMPFEDGQAASTIDALHRTLWLMENRPAELPKFLREAQPSREQMRLVAQALAGTGLTGSELADVSPSAEQAALAKLTSNWRSVIEDAVITIAERRDKRTGQKTFDM